MAPGRVWARQVALWSLALLLGLAAGCAALWQLARLAPWRAHPWLVAAGAVGLASWSAAEVAFYFYYRRLYAKFNRIKLPCRPDGFTVEEGLQHWERFKHTTAASLEQAKEARHATGEQEDEHLDDYIRSWFLDAPMQSIRRGNVADMLCYGYFYRRREEMVGEEEYLPDLMVDELEELLGLRFAPGHTPGLPFMAHIWQDLRAAHRPLAMYAATEALHGVTRLLMAGLGFQRKRLGDAEYYTLRGAGGAPPPPPPSTPRGEPNPLESAFSSGASASQATPVLFLHGVGGLVLYSEMLRHIIALGHPVIVPDWRHVSLRLCSRIPSVDEITRGVVAMLAHEDISDVCVVAHSFGSFVASRLNSLYPERVHSLCLIDPVVIAMFLPQLLFRFLYARPRLDWRRPDVLLRDLVLWFASRDVHIAATFSREFYWTSLNLYPEQLPPGACVVLSGNDDLAPAKELKRMLDGAGVGIKVILNDHLFHGAILLDPTSKASLVQEVAAMLKSGGSAMARLAAPTLTAALSLLHDVSLGHGLGSPRTPSACAQRSASAVSSSSSTGLVDPAEGSPMASAYRRTASLPARTAAHGGGAATGSILMQRRHLFSDSAVAGEKGAVAVLDGSPDGRLGKRHTHAAAAKASGGPGATAASAVLVDCGLRTPTGLPA